MSTSGAELLVRLDTSALESRLNSLTDQWEGQMRGMRGQVDDCTSSVRTVSDDVAAIQRFLLSYHHREMSSVLSNTTEDGSTAAQPADALEKCAVAPAASTTPTEALLKMVTVARRLLADNAALRTSLEQATAAVSSYNETHASLLGEVVRLRELTTQQSARLESMSDWLGMTGLAVSGASAADSDAVPSEAALGPSTEAVLSRSPLLLSFRRFLLRDLTERLTSVVTQQSKDFHDSVAHLESRIQTGQCVVASRGSDGNDTPQAGEVHEDLQETVLALTRQVKELDQRAVKRDEFTSLMRSKADSLLLPVKADSAAVTDLEKRLASRCAELEERCAYADAERAEFRAILRSLIAAQSSPPRAGGSAPMDTVATAAQPTARNGAVLRDLLPALPGGSSPPPASKAAAGGSARGGSSASPPPPQQLYRVVGPVQGLGVVGLPAGAAHDVAAAAPVPAAAPASAAAMTAGSRRDFARPQSTPVKADEEGAVVIGLTSSQSTYATYVSQQLNRKQVAALPTLPYERMTNTS